MWPICRLKAIDVHVLPPSWDWPAPTIGRYCSRNRIICSTEKIMIVFWRFTGAALQCSLYTGCVPLCLQPAVSLLMVALLCSAVWPPVSRPHILLRFQQTKYGATQTFRQGRERGGRSVDQGCAAHLARKAWSPWMTFNYFTPLDLY